MSDDMRPILKEDYDHMPNDTMAGLDMPVHRFANYLPIADDKDQYALRESIKAIGLVEPVVTYDGAILDGRHRYKACMVVGVTPTFIEFTGDDEAALQFVLAKNIARRSLTTIQKLQLREKLMPEIERIKAKAAGNAAAGRVTTGGDPIGDSAKAVAKMVGVGAETMRQYDRVVEAATGNEFISEMLDRVNKGEVSVKKAYTSLSDELDKEAKAQSAKVDPAKLKAARAAAIGKAHALLINHDPCIDLDFEVRELLIEMQGWIEDALDYA